MIARSVLGTTTRALLLLGVCAASVTLFVEQLWGDLQSPFWVANTLSLHDRNLLLGAMVGAALLVSVVALAWLSIRGGDASRDLQRISHLVSPLALMGLLPPVIDTQEPDTLTMLLKIAVFVLVAERTLRLALGAMESQIAPYARPGSLVRWASLACVVIGAIAYAAYMGKYTVFAHRRFRTYGADLGQYDELFFNNLRGRWFRCPALALFENWSSLRGHAELSVLALLPFYAIKPGAESLLVMQAVLLGIGAIPLYRFAARRLPAPYAACVAFAYLLYPPLHGSNFYDFHFQPIAATFIFFAIDFLDTNRPILFSIFLALALGSREDISVGLTLLGLFALASGRKPRAGAAIALVSAAYFVVIRFVVMPRFGTFWFGDIYKDLYPEGDRSLKGVMLTLATNPAFVFRTLLTKEKLLYALHILVPIGFLPIRRPYLWVSLVPGALFTLLTTGYPWTTDTGFQYSGHFTAYIFPASALALAAYGSDRNGRIRRGAAVGAMVLGTVLCTMHWGATPPRTSVHGGFGIVTLTAPTEADREKARHLDELSAKIPSTARVAVSEPEIPHLTTRFDVLTLRSSYDTADYILYAEGALGTDAAKAALAIGTYVELERRPGLVLLRHK